MKYRVEIDGLRAFAVVPVILFHSGFEFFGGGFVGVDIFFVISGYLITTILIESIENNQFSFINFYERRIRRILPVLLVVLIFVYLTSWFIFLPNLHKDVGVYVVTSIFSATNLFLYFKGSSYWGLESSNNPLFHTWSLGVEEQFYFLIPILLFFFWNSNKKWQFSFILIIIFTSLFVNYINFKDPSFNFFMVFSRAWELGLGMLAALIKHNKKNSNNLILTLIGFILVLGSIILIPEDHVLLNFLLIAPVTGSFLIIVFSSKNDFIGRILSFKPFLMIGLISYSLYLWHIPILVYSNYLWGPEVSTNKLLLCLIVLIILSYGSYQLIEKPFRKSVSLKKLIISISVVILSLSLLGIIGHKNGGFKNRSEFIANFQFNNGFGFQCIGNTEVNNNCSTSSKPSTAVLGNSHSAVYVTELKDEYNLNLVQLTIDVCAVGYADKVKDVNSIPCNKFYSEAILTLQNNKTIKNVIISSSFTTELSNELFKDSFIELLNDLKNVNVFVIGPTPLAPFNVGQCLLKSKILNSNRNCSFMINDAHKYKIKTLSKILSNIPHVKFVDITKIICPSNNCKMKIGENDSKYLDDDHLSLSGSSIVIEKITDILNIK